MSRGLTESPEPETNDDSQTMQDAMQDIMAYLTMLAARVEQLEDIMAKALSVHLNADHEHERVNGL